MNPGARAETLGIRQGPLRDQREKCKTPREFIDSRGTGQPVNSNDEQTDHEVWNKRSEGKQGVTQHMMTDSILNPDLDPNPNQDNKEECRQSNDPSLS